jgi:hypothetical protein
MKNAQANTDKGKSQTHKENIRFNANKTRPEIRDNLDSREGEEQNFKGNDVTHNKKEHKSKGTGRKK